MPAASSAERAFDVSGGGRAAMVAIGFVPVLHLLATVVPVALVVSGYSELRLAVLVPLTLYLLPPLVVRSTTTLCPLATGRVGLRSPAFLNWWFCAQWQVVFARMPLLEELLRLVPGLYSLWLRLWGSRIGCLVYWSPGVVLLDRSLVRVGDRVTFGVGARLCPHVIAPDTEGRMLFVAPIIIGDDVMVGGYSTLLPGCQIATGEVTPPFRSIHAFSRWARRRRS